MKIFNLIIFIMFWLIFLKIKYINFFKNGFYLDYFLKLLTKKFVYNFFIFLSFFFAEKYIIEWNTKYIFVYLTYNFSLFFKKLTLNNFYIFIILLFFNMCLFYL